MVEQMETTIADRCLLEARMRIGYQTATHLSAVKQTTIHAEINWKMSTKTPWNRQTHSLFCESHIQKKTMIGT